MNPTTLPLTAQRLYALLLVLGPTGSSNTAFSSALNCSRTSIKAALVLLEDGQLVSVDRHRRNSAAGDVTGRTLTALPVQP